MAYWQPQEKQWTPPSQAHAQSIPIMQQYHPPYPPQQQYQAGPPQQLYAPAPYPQRIPSPAPSQGQWMPQAQKPAQNPYGYSEKQQYVYQQYSESPTPPAYNQSPPTPPSSSGSSSSSPSNRPLAPPPMHHYASVGAVPQYGASSSSLYPPRPSSANSAISAPASSEPSTMAPKSDKTFKDKVKDHFVKRDPLNPPPAQFSRPPNPNLPYGPFQPFSLATNGVACADGFPDVYWGAELEPHDVTPEDWTRFLEDVAIMGRISIGQHAAAGLIPLGLGPLGMYVQYRVTQKMKVKKAPACAQLVDLWNETFFSQRRIRVVLITPEMMKQAAKEGKKRGEEDKAGKLDRRDQNKCRLYVHPI